ncbi:MAG: serine/threonine-protein kinase [Gemmataceae bacterium]|nr:serine/threonine-protein kinase [Gemmataceae bacterium]
MADFDTEREPIEVLAEEFAARYRQGEAPSVSEYVERYPQWADQLRELLPPVAQMEQLKRLKQSSGPHRTDGPPLGQLGDYRILREVGRGGMGIVYEAVQQSLGRHVALKVLPGHALLDPKKLERFRREAQAAANLHHTNIVPIFGVGEQDGLHYYVMQLIEGQGLDRVLAGWRQGQSEDRGSKIEDRRSNRTLSLDPRSSILDPRSERWRLVALMGVEAAEALHYAHQQGVLHRDVKPANLLLDRHGTIWVTDFGLAKVVDREGLTSTGDILGTLQYMAPENLQGQAEVSSDVYSLGLTLYELLTLQPPFHGTDMAALLGSVSGSEPMPPRKINPGIPLDLETIVLKAIAREPAQRYPTAQALAEDLRRFLDDRPIKARRSTPIERFRRWCRRNPVVAGLTAALVLVLLAGFAGVFWKWQEAEAEGRRAEQQGRRAEENLRRAEANEQLSLQALEEIFDHYARRENVPFFPPPPGKPPGKGLGPPRWFDLEDDTVLLQGILKFYDQFARQNATNAKLRREAARAYRRVGDVQQRLNQFTKADTAYRRSASILEQLAEETEATAEQRLEWAETYTLPQPRTASAWELDEGETRLRKALTIAAESDDPISWRRPTLAARTQMRLGTVLQHQGRPDEAEEAYRESVRLRKALADGKPQPPFFEVDLCAARQALADFLLQRERLADARTVYRESIAELERLSGNGPGSWIRNKLLSEQNQALAAALTRMGETALAAEATERAARYAKNAMPPKGGPRPSRDKRPF